MTFLKQFLKQHFPVYALVISLFICFAAFTSKTVTAMAEAAPVPRTVTLVIDPGHGGEDGGATSCSGALESQINLEISLRLKDLLHLMGYQTKMIRTTDTSVYTQGTTISEKKISDLKHRVTLVNETENPVLISIHQNQFSDSRYSGAQVFYAPSSGSKELAQSVQAQLIADLNPGSKRAIKPADSVYLMQHITCPGVLIECGFLSNHEEEAKLRTDTYQLRLCCVIASSVSNFISP